MLVGRRQFGPLGGQRRSVGGVGVASGIGIGGARFGALLEAQEGDSETGLLEVCRGVGLGGGAADDADARPIQFERADRAEQRGDHEALPVEIAGARKIEAEREVPRHGPGAVARQQVDLAVGEGRKARFGRKRHVLDLASVAEHGGSHGAAEVDIEALPGPCPVLLGETAQPFTDAADQLAAGADIIERTGMTDRGRGEEHERCCRQLSSVHWPSPWRDADLPSLGCIGRTAQVPFRHRRYAGVVGGRRNGSREGSSRYRAAAGGRRDHGCCRAATPIAHCSILAAPPGRSDCQPPDPRL